MFQSRSFLLLKLLTLLCVGRSCLAAGIPPNAPKVILEPIRRQLLVCGEQIIVTKIFILVPIRVNTFVSSNTTFKIYDDFTLSITNAPTYIESIYTGTSISYSSLQQLSNSAYTSVSSFKEVESYSFVLQFYVVDSIPNKKGRFLRKRQSSGGFVSGNGQAVNSCQNAIVYNLVQGQLFANTTNSATQFGTNSGVQYANFTPSTSPGSLTTIFSVDSQNNLLWGNTAFFNNAARFCVLPDGTIVAVFVDPQQAPANCIFIALSMTRVSSCAGAANGAFITGPSGPSGAIGPVGPTGLQGSTGIQGISGAVGAQGIQGVSGSRFSPRETVLLHSLMNLQFLEFQVFPAGVPGQSGAIGAQGPSGLQGFSGAVGASGAPGISGAVGQQGVSGAVGATGLQGISGAPGISGAVGATGSQGLSGIPGASGIPGQSGIPGISGQFGASGAPGISGAVGQSGAVGASGAPGVSGIPGASGIPGQSGQVGATGPSGLQGLSGAIGATGPTGLSGAVGATGPSGPQGLSGLAGAAGPTGLSGAVGATGPSGPSGPQGISGVAITGPSGPSGPTGLPGPTGATGIAFAFLGCWTQACLPSGCPTSFLTTPNYAFDTTGTFGGYNTTLTGSSTNNLDTQCSKICIQQTSANYFGTVENLTTTPGPYTADCYCGMQISGNMASGGVNPSCHTCPGQLNGQCGAKGGTIAVYARAF